MNPASFIHWGNIPVSGTTHSAVANGTITICDKANQKQDVANLSRDTANANHSVKDSFDADKVKDKLEIQTAATSLGIQAANAYKAAMEEQAAGQNAALKEELHQQNPQATEAELNAAVKNDSRYINADKEYGPGSDFWRATSGATGLIAGILGGNIQGGVAAGAAPYMAKLVKDATGENEAARIALHGIVSAALAEVQGGNGLAAAAGGMASAALMGDTLAKAFYGKDVKDLDGEQRAFISNLATAVGAAAGGSVGGDTFSAASGANAARVEVENNSLAGDKARESVKESKEATKALIREAMGENLASQLTNGLVNFVGDTGDLGMAGSDLVLDAAMALVSCATGDSYCDTATSDLNKKDQAVGKVLESLFNGQAGEAIKNTVVKAANGDQKALENLAGILTGIVVPAKVLSSGGKTGSMAEKAASKGTGSLVEAEKAALERIGKNSEKTVDLNKPNYSILDKQAAKSDVVVESGKLDYIFGKATSDPHNAARSTQMEQSMYRLGISIDETGAKYLMDHLSQVPKTAGNIVDAYSNQWGKFEVRESLLFGPSDKATKLQSAFQIMPDGSRRFVTTIPKDRKK